MIGISDGRKDLEHDQLTVCDACGRYTRLHVFMTYTALLLFFIPCFKWNKQYYVQSDCCGTVWRLNDEIGQRIARGEHVEIRTEDMIPVNGQQRGRTCARCGYVTLEDFDYCPKCGTKF